MQSLANDGWILSLVLSILDSLSVGRGVLAELWRLLSKNWRTSIECIGRCACKVLMCLETHAIHLNGINLHLTGSLDNNVIPSLDDFPLDILLRIW